VKGKKLRIITIDGKELDLPLNKIKEFLFFGSIDFKIEKKDKVKKILIIPKEQFKL